MRTKMTGKYPTISLWLMLLIAALGCGKAELPVTPEPVTLVEVTAITEDGTRIDSADVFIDGTKSGITPFNVQDIQPGLHALRVSRAGYQSHAEQFIVNRGNTYAFEAVLRDLPAGEGQLIVSANMDSVLVKVTDIGERTVAETYDRTSAYSLPPGGYKVSGELAGMDKIEEQVQIVIGQTKVVNLDFQAGPGEAPTLNFHIDEDSVKLGETFELRWQTNGVQVIIDQSIGVRGPQGTEKLVANSAGQRIFTATAYSAENLTAQVKDTVFVYSVDALPPSLTFSVEQDSVEFGQSANLNWNSDGWQVVIDNSVGVRGPAGSEEVTFQNPGMKRFTATAYGRDNLRTVRKDSVYVKEAPLPEHPMIMLATTRRVTVNTPATIRWQAKNADYVVVDYVNNPDKSGSYEITFTTPGIRIVTATAFNPSGYVSAIDTINVIEPEIETVEDILIDDESEVRADKGQSGMEDIETASFEVITAGRYKVMTEVWYNSGDSQRNESFYLTISDNGSVNLPRDPNAGNDKVVPDDPGDPHTIARDSGTFLLAEGRHYINVYHYAKIADIYPQFINDRIRGPESVKIIGFKLVYEGN